MPSERVFSTAGDIVTAQRSALNAENVDKLIFLKKKLSAINMFEIDPDLCVVFLYIFSIEHI